MPAVHLGLILASETGLLISFHLGNNHERRSFRLFLSSSN